MTPTTRAQDNVRPELDPWHPDVLADPFPHYQRLRAFRAGRQARPLPDLGRVAPRHRPGIDDVSAGCDGAFC
jgi:hypothetical protein